MTETKIIHVISSLTRGGRERQLATIYKHGDRQLYPTKIVVFNKTKDDYIAEYNIKDVDLIFLKTKKPQQRLHELIGIFKQEKPAIVYAWGGFEASFCFLASPYSPGRFVNGSIRHGKVVFNSKHMWRLFVLQLSKYIVANSKAGIRANKLKRGYVLYNGIDEKFIHQPTKTEKARGKEKLIPDLAGEIVLVSVANLVPFKDYKTTIDALGRLKKSGQDFHYFIIGDGPMRETIQQQISTLGLSKYITITGKISNVKDYLQIGDIFIHSSLGEGCSNAILEAMAAGLPIIASNTGGTSEIAGDWNGRLFDYQNTDELTDALKHIMSNPSEREKMGQASFDSINEKFTIPEMVSNYYNIISQIRK